MIAVATGTPMPINVANIVKTIEGCGAVGFFIRKRIVLMHTHAVNMYATGSA
jgi:hypothetical protein